MSGWISRSSVRVYKDAECIRATAQAICVKIKGLEVWIPKSVVDDDSEVYDTGGKGKLVIKTWWAEKNDFDITADDEYDNGDD